MSDVAQSTPYPNKALTMGAIITVLLLASLGQTIITTALPIIVGDLGGLEHISWAITAYLLAATIGSPLFGKMGDTFGRKIVLQAGIVVFLIGSLIAAAAPNMTVLVAGRYVQGLGGGGLIVTSMAAVADMLPPRQRGRAQALVGAAFAVSTVVGPLLGGLIVEQFTWPWLFVVNVPIGILALITIAIAFKGRPERKERSIDYAGAVVLTISLSAIVIVTSLGGTIIAWGSPVALALYATAVGALVAFIVIERRAKDPMIPLFLFRNNAFLVSNSAGLAVGTIMFGAITFIPFYLQIVKGFTPTQAGLGLLPMMLGLITTSMLAGTIMARTGRYKFLPIGASVLLFMSCIALATINEYTPVWLTMVYLTVLGAGIGPTINVGITAIQNAVPREVLGVGTASSNMFRQIGGSVGVAMLGAVFGNRLVSEVGSAAAGGTAFDAEAIMRMSEAERLMMVSGYAEALHPVFWLAAAAAAFAFAVNWLLREVPIDDEREAALAE